jgi:hypothetical protein
MCLITKKKFRSRVEALAYKPTIAKKDIKVYKVLWKHSHGSSYRGFKYEKGNEYYQTGKPFTKTYSRFSKKLIISRGLHAWITKEDAIRRHNRSLHVIVEMVIPKGSMYYLGDNDDIVSNRLIWY